MRSKSEGSGGRKTGEDEESRSGPARWIVGGLAAVIVIAVIVTAVLVTKKLTGRKQVNPADVAVPEYVNVNLLTPNEYSRPQIPLEKVNGIVVHYVANFYALPGNRIIFED